MAPKAPGCFIATDKQREPGKGGVGTLFEVVGFKRVTASLLIHAEEALPNALPSNHLAKHREKEIKMRLRETERNLGTHQRGSKQARESKQAGNQTNNTSEGMCSTQGEHTRTSKGDSSVRKCLPITSDRRRSQDLQSEVAHLSSGCSTLR